MERQADAKEKTGVFIGAYATNPVNGARIPIFIADYVLAGYGTGAIMAVPGQDERDWEFAEVFDLPIIRTVQPPEGFEGKAYTGEGPAINSRRGCLDGLGVAEAKATIIDWLEAHGHGAGRDHLPAARLAVQPAAVLGRAVPDRLRRDRPAGRAARVDAAGRAARGRRLLAAHASTRTTPTASRRRRCRGRSEWVEVELDLGDGPKRYTRETNTMPQWAGSCWYELRYLDPTNDKAFVDPENERVLDGPAARRRLRRRRPVRRRRRARRAAPAVRPVLAQGAVRPGPRVVVRAVPPAVQPGLHPGVRVHRRPRQSYVPAEEVVERDGGYYLRRRRRSTASTARWASR